MHHDHSNRNYRHVNGSIVAAHFSEERKSPNMVQVTAINIIPYLAREVFDAMTTRDGRTYKWVIIIQSRALLKSPEAEIREKSG